MSTATRQDRDDLVRLVRTLDQLSRDMAQTYEPAAARVGCFLGIAHMQRFRLASDSGTAYSIIVALRQCLAGKAHS